MNIVPNIVIGEGRAFAFVHRDGGCTAEAIQVPRYSEQDLARGRRLRQGRRHAGLTLGAAAKLLGLNVVQVSELERGRVHAEPEEPIHDAYMKAWAGKQGGIVSST